MNHEEQNMRDAFVRLAEEQVGKGIYVWGGNGESLEGIDDAHAFIDRRETTAQNRERCMRLYEQRVKDGQKQIRAFDCSGLVYWTLKTLGVQKTDVSSRGLYALCEPIGKDELVPGDLVFHHDGTQIVHVGIFAGNGEIECRGRDFGVVHNKRPNGYWNRFGRLKAFVQNRQHAFVHIIGGSIRVRAGDGIKSRCVGIVHRGEHYPLLGTGASGWYRILWQGLTVYITNKPQYTEVRYG